MNSSTQSYERTQQHQRHEEALAEQHPDLPDGLPNQLVRTLALLEGAEPRAARPLLASLAYGSRAALAAYGLIEPISGQLDAISPINITPGGWAVIRASAEVYSPSESQLHEWAVELDIARESHSLGRKLRLSQGLSALLETAWQRIEQRRRDREHPLGPLR
jgi:hypothetical protein